MQGRFVLFRIAVQWLARVSLTSVPLVITDISNPQFDLEKLMMKVADDPESI